MIKFISKRSEICLGGKNMKNLKKGLSVLLSLMLVLGAVFCVPAAADGDSAYQIIRQDRDPLNFDTLTEAMDAAQDGDTVMMTQDAEETFSGQAIELSDKSVVLDLNGHTLSLSSGGLCEMINLIGARFTIGDSSGNPGSIVLAQQGSGSGADSPPLFCYIDNLSVLKITDGIYIIAESEISCSDIIYVEGILGIINANFNETTDSGACMIHASLGSTVQIRDCSCHWDDLIQTDECAYAYIFNGFYETGSSLLGQQGLFSIIGGTFNQDVSPYVDTYFSFDCSLSGPDEQGYYYVRENYSWQPGCELSGMYFESLSAATHFALDGDTIKLFEDVSYNDVFHMIDITLDLNGHTITGGNPNFPSDYYMFYLDNNAGLTICDSSGGNGTVLVYSKKGFADVEWDSKLTLKDGVTILNEAPNVDDFILVESGEINIVNANFKDECNMMAAHLIHSKGESTVNIAAGTFDWWTDLINSYNNDKISIIGGRFIQNVSEWVPDGYYVTERDDEFFCTVLPLLYVAAHSLTLGGDIGVNFYVKIKDVSDDVYAEFTVDGKTVTVPIDLSKYKVFDDGSTAYKFTCNVAAAQIGETITGRVYAGEYSTDLEYSVYDYLTELSENPEYMQNEDLEDLARAIAVYGYYANELFGYYDGLAPHALFDSSGMQTVTAQLLSESAPVISNTDGNINYAGSTLVLRTKTAIRHYFTLPEGKTIDNYTFALGEGDNAEFLTPVLKGRYYYVEISDIPSAELGDETKVTVTVNTGGNAVGGVVGGSNSGSVENGYNTGIVPVSPTVVSIWRYSALSYAYLVLSSYENGDESVSAELVNAVKALVLYYNAADAYFAAHTGD